MMALLEMVVGAIVEIGVQSPLEKAWDKVKHKEAVIKVLKKVNLDPDTPPNEFEAIYAYTLVEWGMFKPEPLLNFFRYDYVRNVFRRAFTQRDLTILEKEAKEIISWNEETNQLGRLHRVPSSEIEAFTAVFHTLVDRARTPVEIRQDHQLADIHEQSSQILTRLAPLEDMSTRLQQLHAWAQPPADKTILTPYLKMVLQQSQRLRLSPLDPSGRKVEGAHISLNQVFVNLDADNFVIKQVNPNSQKTTLVKYSAALAHIHAQPQLILLGDPGSGKSTLLRFLAYGLAHANLEPKASWLESLKWTETHFLIKENIAKRLDELAEAVPMLIDQKTEIPKLRARTGEAVEKHWTAVAPIPIFVELRDFAQTQFDPRSPTAIWEFITHRLQLTDKILLLLQEYAVAGNVIFLLDGVDEVPPLRRPAIWQAIHALQAGIYGGNRWLATCRVLSFVPEEAPVGVPNLTLQPLHKAQIVSFIERWYSALAAVGELPHAQANSFATQLKQATKRQRLRLLAQNPMLLTIMALVQTYGGVLPDERAKLYQACVETLLLNWQRHKEWDKAQQLPNVLEALAVRQEELEELLWEIAWQAHSQAPEREAAADIPEADVLKIARKFLGSYAKAETFLTYTERRAHLLVGRGGIDNRVYTFPHRTIQEYLAACYVASEYRLLEEAPILAAQGETWREVLNLAAGTLVFNWRQRKAVLLAAERMLPREEPALVDEAGWFRVWLAAEMTAVVGRQQVERDERIGQTLLPHLRQQLEALLEKARLTPRQRVEAGRILAQLGDVRNGVCTLEPTLTKIPAGSFVMGDEGHEITLAAFEIGRYPITNAQYRFFVEDGGYTAQWQHCWTDEGWRYKDKGGWTAPRYWNDLDYAHPNQPVVGVSWYEAVAYAAWLGHKTNQPYRLPTEAEWERVARSTDGRRYSWGSEWIEGKINAQDAGVGQPSPVGYFPDGATAEGVQDMCGNVWEWCQTRWQDEARKEYPRPYQPNDGRERLSGEIGVWRVLRGGSYANDETSCRGGFRGGVDPNYRLRYFGIRVVVSLP